MWYRVCLQLQEDIQGLVEVQGSVNVWYRVCLQLQEDIQGLVEVQGSVNVWYRVCLQLQEDIQGLVEVQGSVNERNEVVCQSYILFPGENTENFGTCFPFIYVCSVFVRSWDAGNLPGYQGSCTQLYHR